MSLLQKWPEPDAVSQKQIKGNPCALFGCNLGLLPCTFYLLLYLGHYPTPYTILSTPYTSLSIPLSTARVHVV